jgi:hypothetical protein
MKTSSGTRYRCKTAYSISAHRRKRLKTKAYGGELTSSRITPLRKRADIVLAAV